MKLRILSDLHVEFDPHWVPAPVEADVVVLAGDVGIKGRGVAWAQRAFQVPTIFVPGNHDYYGGSLGHTLKKMREAAQGSHVHVLHDEQLVIEGVRFLGSTLWTDYRLTGNEPLAQWDAQQVMSDFKKIRNEQFSKLRASHLALRHGLAREFLTSRLGEPFAGPTVVVTHHAPCELSIHEDFKTEGHLNASYASRLEHLMGEAVSLWVHGHTHCSFDYELYGTRVVCNPRGYAPKELNRYFDETLVIEV